MTIADPRQSLENLKQANDDLQASRARIVAMHEMFIELGKESPYDDKWFERPDQDHRITTRVHTGEWADVRWEALLAHATQIDPESPFWFGLPREVAATVHPWDEYILALSHVDSDESTGDLFHGITADAPAGADA